MAARASSHRQLYCVVDCHILCPVTALAIVINSSLQSDEALMLEAYRLRRPDLMLTD